MLLPRTQFSTRVRYLHGLNRRLRCPTRSGLASVSSPDGAGGWSAATSCKRPAAMAAVASCVTALLAVLDAGALYRALLSNTKGLIQARLCRRGGFTCLGNIARALRIPISEDADPKRHDLALVWGYLEAIDRLLRADYLLERRSRMHGRTTWVEGSTTRLLPRHPYRVFEARACRSQTLAALTR